MKRSNRLILLIGLFLAAIAFVGIIVVLGNGGGGGGGGGTANTDKSTIVVASVDIPLGTTITGDMVTTQEVKTTEKPAGSYTLTSEVVGQTVTTAVTSGQILTPIVFATSTTINNVTKLLDPGTAAIAVTVDQVTGAGTLIKPGDHVDVVLAMTEADNKNPITVEKAPTKEGQPPTTVRNFQVIDPLLNNTTVKVLVQDLKVVGTLLPPPPSSTTSGQPAASAAPAAPSLNGQTEIVLLQVTPQQAELIRYTQIDGNLSLVLRAPLGPDATPLPAVTTTGITLRQLVDKYGVLPPKIILTQQP